MALVDTSAFDGDVPYTPPVTFKEAWASVMTSRAKREWVFNNHLPSANELLRARENKPFCMSMFLNVPSDVAFETNMYRVRIEDLCCTSRRLRDGTYLGFVLNNLHSDFTVPCFTAFDPCFGDPKLNVVRLICGAVGGRLFVMEFCWMKSRALTVRFSPFKSLSVSRRNDLRMDHVVFAFLPSDVPTLSAMALCPGEPNDDLVNARFDRILLSEDLYTLEVSDTHFQVACVFCSGRGLAVCGCPLPMRRRSGAMTEVVGYKQRTGKSIWEDFSVVKSFCAQPTNVVFNITKAPHSLSAKVMESGVFPFDTVLEHNFVTNSTLQKHLMLTGQSVYATRTVLMPFSLRDSAKRKVTAPPSETQDFTAAITISSVKSNNDKSSLSGTSSSNELISLIRGTQKRSRLQPTSQVAESPVLWNGNESAGASADVGTVNHTTTTIASNVEVVTKVFSWSDKSKSGSAASGNEKQKREPPPQQQQSKVFPCPECGVLIKNKRYNLKRHIQVVHQKERKFECTVPSCGQRFQTKTNLKRHVSTVHKRQQMLQEQEQRLEQQQQESRQTMQRAPMSDSLFNIHNDVNVQ